MNETNEVTDHKNFWLTKVLIPILVALIGAAGIIVVALIEHGIPDWF